MLTHWPLSLGQFSCSCCCWENWSPHHDCMLVDTFSPISTLSVNVFWRGDTVRVSPFISEVWLRFTVSPLKLLPARQKTRRYDHRLACEMSGKMQETEIETSSLFEKNSAICSMTSFAILKFLHSFSTSKTNISPIFNKLQWPLYFIASILPVLWASKIFLFQCYTSITDLMKYNSDFTACCGVIKFTPISDLRRAFLTASSGWVCLSQL